MNSFSELGTSPFFTGRLAERGITVPTEIQRLVIPSLLSGESVLFNSATGTGKTFAYLIPLFQTLFFRENPPPGSGGVWPRLLICAPTYELCSQIKGEAGFLLRNAELPPRVNLVIGGTAMGRQIDALRKDRPPVIIGNPGRLLQIARTGRLHLNAVEALVLDEADRLTTNELFADTAELVSLVKGSRQTAACSATLPPKSRERLLPMMGGSPRILAGESGEVLRHAIEHWALFSEERRKIGVLRSFLAAAAPRKALIFTARPWQVGNIVSQLQYHHLAAGALHGGMDKQARKRALEDFRQDRIHVLVTSDLAARGLDISGVTHIIALDVPESGDAYIHRSGRTGRAGNRGLMVTIGDEKELRRLAKLEKKLGIVIYPKELFHGRIMAPPREADEK